MLLQRLVAIRIYPYDNRLVLVSKVIINISLDISVCHMLMFKYKMERMNIYYVGRNLKLTMNISSCWRMLWRLKIKILWEKIIVLDEIIPKAVASKAEIARKRTLYIIERRVAIVGSGAWKYELAIF